VKQLSVTRLNGINITNSIEIKLYSPLFVHRFFTAEYPSC